MDDLKLYGKSKEELESLVQTVRIFTDDVKMRFGLNPFIPLGRPRSSFSEPQSP